MTKQMKKTSQIPIEINAHFRYICPDIHCRYDHWISLKEAQTKNFKIVCDCGKVFKPKTIVKVKLIYKHKSKSKPSPPQDTPQTNPIKPTRIETVVISQQLLESCQKHLINYGFTESEAIQLINKAFGLTQIQDVSELTKYILAHIPQLETV